MEHITTGLISAARPVYCSRDRHRLVEIQPAEPTYHYHPVTGEVVISPPAPVLECPITWHDRWHFDLDDEVWLRVQ
jgi:hypothetical protein